MSLTLRITEWLSVRKRGADLATLRATISPGPDTRLLDVGGGAGAATERFATGCGSVVVLEPDAKKVAFGRRRRPSITFEDGRGESIPFPDATFDWVVSIVALHHVEHAATALREMYRVLGDSGRIAIMEMPPSRSPGHRVHWLSRVVLIAAGGVARHGGHMEFLEPEAWKAKLEAAGFREVTWTEGVAAFLVTGRK